MTVNRKNFSEKDKIKMLLWCDRHCCLCEKSCGGNIEIHHIDKINDNSIENGIPLCFECHGMIHAYKENPKGTHFRKEELKTRRNQIYRKYTSYLVPPLMFEITQLIGPRVIRKLPDVGFNITHTGGAYPVKAKVYLKIFLNGKIINDLEGKDDYYGGGKVWRLNPGNGARGHFSIPKEVLLKNKQLKIEVRVKIIDIYDYEHELLPVEWVYLRDQNNWYFEP